MIGRIAFVPTPPALVPEVSPGAPEGVVAAREASVAAARSLAADNLRWVAVAAADPTRSAASAGTFGGFGPDLVVALTPVPGPVSADLPLPLLIAGWLRGQVAPDRISVDPVLVGPGSTAAVCLESGGEIAADHPDVGLLVLGDGATTHGTAAPGYADDRAPQVEGRIAAALAAADTAAIAALEPGLCTEVGVSGREAWQVAAGVADAAAAAGGGTWHSEVLYQGAPLGVGYHVVVWNRR